MRNRNFIFYLGLLLALAGCSQTSKKEKDHETPIDNDDRHRYSFGSLLGNEGLIIGGGVKKSSDRTGVSSNVNVYLWKASLDTLQFMPLANADANGGIIVTDWYVDPKKPTERLKVHVMIKDIILRADALTVTVHKQKLISGQWQNQSLTDTKIATDLENIILTKARHLRIQAKNSGV